MYSEALEIDKIFDLEEEGEDENLVNVFNNDEVIHKVTEKKNGKIIFTKVDCETSAKRRKKIGSHNS